MGGDTDRDENYQKTFLWSVPPSAVKGTITEDKTGKTTFRGKFSTPGTPAGKDPDQLTDDEKAALLKIYRAERDKVDEFAKSLEKAPKAQVPKFVRATFVPLRVTITGPRVAAVGETVTLRAHVSNPLGTPVKVERYDWNHERAVTTETGLTTATFSAPGVYRVRLRVRDTYDAEGVGEHVLVVRAKGAAK